MKVKINGKPTQISKDDNGSGIDKVYLTVSTFGYLMIFWIMDVAAHSFLGTCVFPWTHIIGWIFHWIGVISSWL